MAGKRGAVDAGAALVERHQHGFVGDQGSNRTGFVVDPRRRVARPAFRNFQNIEAAKTELAADIVEAIAVTLGQFPFGALLEPAD